jgi:predicted outer membrane protein
MTTALALAVTPAYAQSGSGAAGQPGNSGTGSGQSSPTGGQAGTSGAGSATSIPGGGQSAPDDASRASRGDDRQQFVEKAAMANMAEIQLGQLALQNAQDPQVKQFAQTMVDEHTKALAALRSAAGSAQLPTALDKKHQKVHDKLSKLQGAEFDREYMEVMVDAHKDAEKLLKKRVGDNGQQSARGESGTAGAVGTSGSTSTEPSSSTASESSSPSASADAPASVDQWASTTLPKVQSHLQQARSLEDQLKQSAQPANQATPGTSGSGSSGGGTSAPGSTTPPQR